MKRKKWTLKKYYQRFNRIYFGNKLPDIPVKFEETARKGVVGETTFFGSCPVRISISPNIRYWDKIVLQVLLHECAHVALPANVQHGPRFDREIARLFRAGAFRGLM